MGISVAVVGPGAIGSTMAALLHAAGHQVLLCGHTPRDQVEVRPDDKDPIVVPGPVLTDPADVDGPVDVVLLAVKDTQNRERRRLAGPALRRPHGGVRAAERRRAGRAGGPAVPVVRQWCPRSCGSPPSRIQRAGSGCAPASGWCCPSGDAARDDSRICCDDTEVTVELDPDFTTAAWRKLLVNALADFMVLTGRRSGMFRRDDVAALSRRYLAECLAVARAEGANLGDEVIDEIVDLFAKAPEDMTTSMLTDREAHRPLEWDIRNGVISRKAAAARPGHTDQ